jgi:hypothetical protein
MFSKRLKSKYSNGGFERGSRNFSRRRRNYNLLSFTHNYSQSNIFKIFWNYTLHHNNHSYILGETSKFFRAYKKHSKDIARIIKQGYGNGSIVGSVNYFDIKYPEEPQIEDIGIATIHLKKDFPDIWKEKNTVFQESKKYLDNIRTIITEFEIEVRKTIEENFDYRQCTEPNEDIDKVCYYPDTFLEIFKIIQNKGGKDLNPAINGKHPYYSYDIISNRINPKPLFHITTTYEKFSDFWTNSNEIIDILIKNNKLKDLVKKYEKECSLFYNNSERKKFFTSINKLHNNIVNHNNTMNKKGRCGAEGCIGRFRNLMFAFSR